MEVIISSYDEKEIAYILGLVDTCNDVKLISRRVNVSRRCRGIGDGV